MGKKFKTILAYGAVLSLPMILMSVLSYVFNITDNKSFGFISIIIFAASIVFIQIHYRKNSCEGFASYGKILGGTLLMVLISAVILFVYTYLFYKFLAQDQLQHMLEIARVNLEEQGQLSSSDINKSYEFMSKHVFTPIAMSIMTVFTTFIQGLLISLISSVFTRKKDGSFTDAMRGIGDE